MSEELKPCPFCGGEKIRDRFIRDGRQVYCADCSASVTAFQPNATEGAKSLWNCRPEVAARPTLDTRHEFSPNKKYPWFCAHCGYAPHEPLKHFQKDRAALPTHPQTAE